jgi:excisionase family DNA binding protein
VKRQEHQSRAEVVWEILSTTWMHAKKRYRLPDTPDGFSRYIRSTVSKVKQPRFALEQGDEDIEDLSIAISETPALRRQGNGTWTNHPSGSRSLSLPSVQEAARAEGIGLSTFYKLLDNGTIPASRTGNRIQLKQGWQQAVQGWKNREQGRQQRATANQVYIRAWAMKRGIPLTSAKKQVARWRLAELEEQEIVQRIGLEWVEKAMRESARGTEMSELPVVKIRGTRMGKGEKWRELQRE